jgi:hypothetical protein
MSMIECSSRSKYRFARRACYQRHVSLNAPQVTLPVRNVANGERMQAVSTLLMRWDSGPFSPPLNAIKAVGPKLMRGP